MSNPYETPSGLEAAPTVGDLPVPSQQPPGMVSQIRVVAVLMGLQGVLVGLLGAFLVCMGIFFGTALRQAMREDGGFQQGRGPSPDMLANILGGTYGGLGLLLLAIGIVHGYAAYRNFQFKGRTLGIVSLSMGILTAITIYCACTSIPLFIYGLIVYLNSSVASAFRMGDQGYSADTILSTFSPARYNQQVPKPPPPK